LNRDATTAEKFGSQHRGTCAPHPATGQAGMGVGRGSPLTLWRSGVKTHMLNPAFWWLLRSLMGS